MTEIGQKPVVLNKEIDGFALNRIQYVMGCVLLAQNYFLNYHYRLTISWHFTYKNHINRYALLNEAWRLVADGVLSVKDIDAVMSEGLGMRYAFIGMFEAAHLNAEGEPVIKNYLYNN